MDGKPAPVMHRPNVPGVTTGGFTILLEPADPNSFGFDVDQAFHNGLDFEKGANGAEKNYERAIECYRESECPNAVFRLAYLGLTYAGITGMDHVAQKALEGFNHKTNIQYVEDMLTYLRPIVKMKNPHANFCAGLVMLKNEETNAQGLSYIKKSADAGEEGAQLCYGNLLTQIERFDQAFVYLKKSADQGNPAAQFQVAKAYIGGAGVEWSVPNAFPHLLLSAAGGHVEAQFILETMYEEGLGVEKDAVKAQVYRDARGGRESELGDNFLPQFRKIFIPARKEEAK